MGIVRRTPSGDRFEAVARYYRSALFEALDAKARIREMDRELACEEAGFQPRPLPDGIRGERFGMRYFYIPVETHSGRLSDEDRALLDRLYDAGAPVSDPFAQRFALAHLAQTLPHPDGPAVMTLGFLARFPEDEQVLSLQRATLEGLAPVIRERLTEASGVETRLEIHFI